MSTVDAVHDQLQKVLHAHHRVSHHSVRRAREVRAARAAVAAAGSPEAVQVPDLEPDGMPAPTPGTDPLAGL